MRLLHTMLRVGDLQRSIDFYTKVLGMTLLRTTERPEQGYTLAFVGYGSNPDHAEIELTYNHGVNRYDLGTAYGHIALGVPDVAASDIAPSSSSNIRSLELSSDMPAVTFAPFCSSQSIPSDWSAAKPHFKPRWCSLDRDMALLT